MVLAAVTVTVYFIGLVNFHQCTAAGCEVIVPQAPAMRFEELDLEAHQADVTITGLKSSCAAIGGTPSGSDCQLLDAKGIFMALPTAAPARLNTTGLANLPKLSGICPGIKGLNSAYLTDPSKYAVRLTLKHGDFSTCRMGDAWVTSYKVVAESGAFSVTDKDAVKKDGVLNTTATIYVVNAPTRKPPDASQEKHFWWYYAMHDDAGCDDLPTVATAKCDEQDNCCPAAVMALAHARSMPAASGAGCSNTAYP